MTACSLSVHVQVLDGEELTQLVGQGAGELVDVEVPERQRGKHMAIAPRVLQQHNIDK